MHELAPVHGGAPVGVPHDLSTNANRLGPCPSILSAVRAADLARYPDPSYKRLREALAARHDCDPRRVVVGAGASELILRLVRRYAGPVRVLGSTFSEYRRCALLEGRSCTQVSTVSALATGGGGLGFVCWPNNPTGGCPDLAALTTASGRSRLVLDLAYADLVSKDESLRVAQAVPAAWHLFSPNKAFGLTGLRAAYLIAPEPDELLEHLGASWVLDAAGAAFLEASAGAAAQGWLDSTRPVLHRFRSMTALGLRMRGVDVLESPANYLMARVGDVGRFRLGLIGQGVYVRDASSFGLPGWIRLAGASPEVLEILSRFLDAWTVQSPLYP